MHWWGRRFACPRRAMSEYRRKLPHFQPEGIWLFVTWRLWGSLPAGHTAGRELHATPGHAFVAHDRILDVAVRGECWLKGSVANRLWLAFAKGELMRRNRPVLFRGRHFEDQIIVLCVRWYLSYSLSYRDLEQMMAERDLGVDHSTIARWVLRYAPELNKRIRHELRHPNRSWRVDETYVRVAGRWTYLYRAVDSTGQTIEFMLSPKRDTIAAKHFFRLALARAGQIRPRVINVDGHPAYPNVIADLKRTGETGAKMPLPTGALPEQHHRAGSPLH